MLKLFILAFLACSLYTSQAQKTCDLSQFAQDPTVVETINGKVQGKCAVLGLSDPDLGSRSISVLSWLGIPFAQPPVGERRFMSPATPLNWTETRAATDFSKNCIQSGDANTMSEDCLYVNVYAPLQKSDKPLPVYIYVHAGGLVSGSGSSLNGAPIVAHSNIIVVTFNYRLGVMGFMHLPDLGITGNAGFLDQRMAFKWVYNNIGKFNGDKTKITIGGHSAGGWSIGFHLVHQPSWKYYTNVIMISGSAAATKMALLSSSDASNRATGAFESSGCPASLGKTARLQCIQDPFKINANNFYKDAQSYVRKNVLTSKASSNLNPVFQLVLNGIEFNETLKDSFTNGRYKTDASILSGHTKNEGGYYFDDYFKPNEPLEIDNTRFKAYIDNFYFYLPTYPQIANDTVKQQIVSAYTVPNQKNYLSSLIQMLGETVYICPTINLARLVAKNTKVKVFEYSYDHFGSGATTNPAFGVSHGMTSQMWNGNPLISSKNPSEEKILSRQILTYWTNYVKYGNPNIYDTGLDLKLKGIQWPQFIVKSWTTQPELDGIKFESYLSLKVNITATNDHSFEKCDLWKQYESLP